MDINRTYDLNEDEIDNIEESKDEKTLKAELFQYCKENNSEMVVKLLSNNVSPHYIDPISLWTVCYMLYFYMIVQSTYIYSLCIGVLFMGMHH